jgi:CHAT domain-containing protein/Tfp pilus assembly protein PilF
MVKALLGLLLPLTIAACVSAQMPKPETKPSPEVQKQLDVAEKLPAKTRLPSLAQALDLARRLKDRVGEGRALLGRGACRHELSQNKEALSDLEDAASITAGAGDTIGQIEVLDETGSVLSDLGQNTKAESVLKEALALAEQEGYRKGLASALNNLGEVCWSVGQNDRALEYFARALPIERELDDLGDEASTLNDLGMVSRALGQLQKAQDYYSQALIIERKLGDRGGEATLLSNLGVVYGSLGQPQRALDQYVQALPILREIGERGNEAATLNAIGLAYNQLGQLRKALDYYMQALPLRREVGNRMGEAITLSNIGMVYDALGEKSKALEYYEEALPIHRAVGDRPTEARTLSNIGSVYESLGQTQKALDYFARSLPIRRKVGDRIGEAATLNNIGQAYSDLGQKQSALDDYALALQIERETGDRRGEALTLGNMGAVYSSLGQKPKALEYYARALPIEREVGNARVEGISLSNIGSVYDFLGQEPEALDNFLQALPIQRGVNDRDVEAITHGQLGGALRKMGVRRLAILQLKQSVLGFQSLRSDVARMGPGARRTYAEQSGATYLALATCLAAEGRATEAEQFLFLSRTDTASEAASDAPFTDFERRTQANLETRTIKIADIERKVSDARALKRRTPAQADELKRLEAAKDGAESEFRRYFDLAIEDSKHIDPSTNVIAETAASKGISAALAALPAGTAIVYALLDNDAVHLIVERRGHRDVLTAAATGLESKAAFFRDALQHPDLDPRPLGKQLYDVLFKPIKSKLDPRRVTAWCLTGLLRGIPVGALYDGKSFVFEKYPTVSFSPAFVPELAKRPSHRAGAIVAGVTGKASVPDPNNGVPVSFDKLTSVHEEATTVAVCLRTKPMLDGDFTTKTLVSSLKKHPGVIHLASHFRYVPGDDRRSFLLTGANGAWTVDSIKSLPDNALRGVDLVTLSACATGEGESATGEEAESFAAWMQRKGAGAVLSTLWPIADRSTALLFGEFYRLRQAHPNWTKIEALRQAQLEMLQGRLVGDHPARTRSDLGKKPSSKLNAPPWPANLPKYAHPYYWAPFVLTGNWQ